MTNTIVCEIPYAEMKPDSYDASSWLNSMDLVCDGDREVCVVICTGVNKEIHINEKDDFDYKDEAR